MSPEILPVRSEPSMADLRAMRDTTSEPTEVKQEPVAPAKADAATEAVKEPVEKKQEPTESDEPLPPGVEKRIAKEAEKAARIQSEIDRAVSTRKAKEKELADLTASGSAPVQKADTAVKKAPEFGGTGHESETYAQFQARDREHLRAEIAAETRKSVEQEFTQRHQETAAKEKWSAAVTAQTAAGTIKDAAEFSTLMEKAQEIAPEGLQKAISSLDDWAGVAIHLAKDGAKLKELATLFGTNPYAAIAKLGRIEASLKTASKPAVEPLPDPPAKDGGGASATVGAFDIGAASMRQLRGYAVKQGIRKAG